MENEVKEEVLRQVWEQDAIFDGEPELMEGSLVMSVLNHRSFGGTPNDMRDLQKKEHHLGLRHTLRRYKVQVVVTTTEYD
jgi:hypothetical protein